MILLAPFSVPIKNYDLWLPLNRVGIVYCPPVPDGLQRRKQAFFFLDSSTYQTGLFVTVTETKIVFEVHMTA